MNIKRLIGENSRILQLHISCKSSAPIIATSRRPFTIVRMSEEAGDWVVVRNKAEQSRQLRGHTGVSVNFPPLQQDTGQRTDLNTLVGAPIRIETYHQNADIANKIGDSLHLAVSDVSSSDTKSPNKFSQVAHPNAAIDLSDTGEWPSMGVQGGVAPQLGLWTAVVKKPVPPVAPQVFHHFR